MNRGPVLVVGATGQQGGATARALLSDGWPVHALTRDPDSAAAKVLAALGAELVTADLEDTPALVAAMRGLYGVFSVQNFMTAGLEGEVRQGQAVAEAAGEAGVSHFVYTSVGGAERASGVPHFESKWAIEQRITELGLPATVLRPALFMDNFANAQARWFVLGMLQGSLRPSRRVQMIAVDDIGVFAARAFSDPQRWIGRTLELAGDALTISDIGRRLAAAEGDPDREIPSLPPDAGGTEMTLMTRWFDEHGHAADIDALRLEHPQLLDLDGWLRRHPLAMGSA